MAEWVEQKSYWRTDGRWWYLVDYTKPTFIFTPHVVEEPQGVYSVDLFYKTEPTTRTIAGPFDTLEAAQAAAELIS